MTPDMALMTADAKSWVRNGMQWIQFDSTDTYLSALFQTCQKEDTA